MPAIVHGADRRPLVPGRTLFDEADELALMVPASCRRTGRCHECVVEVRAGSAALSQPTRAESFLAPGFRLACQATVVRDDLDLEFAVLRRRLRILPGSATRSIDVDPAVEVRDGRVRRDDGEDLGPALGPLLGLAVDVGTTTVVVELLDLASGATVAATAFENPQRFGGSDVMTRISYEARVPGELRLALRRALNHALRELYASVGADRRQVVEAVLVGNTTMRDLAFGLDVAPIGRLPYRSVTEAPAGIDGPGASGGEADRTARGDAPATTAIERHGHELGLLIHPRARVLGGPIVASHVGADTAADLVAVDAAHATRPFLLVDIGTNTEVVAGDGRRLVAASGPAGPAFEGGGVRHGMAGADGAIEGVRIEDGRFVVRTIGDAPPEGLCGSGLVALLAALRADGRMTARGAFGGRAREVTVVEGRGITLSTADVGHLAVAKAATAVGQRVLLRRLGLAPGDLDRVYLAGGFANALDPAAAIAIGLLVDVPPERVVRAGNAAIDGAAALVCSRRRRAELAALVRRIEHVELEAEPDFFDLFTDGCLFEPIAPDGTR